MMRNPLFIGAAAILLGLAPLAEAQLNICGDVDQSEIINILDAFMVAQSTVGMIVLTAPQIERADVNSDMMVTITDALQIAQFVVLLRLDLGCTGAGFNECDAPGTAILDFQTINETITVSASFIINNDLEIDVEIRHTYIGDLRVTLIHPDATQVVLHDQSGGSAANIIGTYPTTLTPLQSLTALNGKNVIGTWTLRIADLAGGDSGTLVTWCVRAGSAPLAASHTPYSRLAASRTGNNLIPYPFARLTGGGIVENTIQFSAEAWSTGPNTVAEDGMGDDFPLGPLPGGSWSTTLSATRGTIDPVSGLFTAGDITGSGMVNYVNPTHGNASFQVAVVPPDWR